jgi:hypothetical protein
MPLKKEINRERTLMPVNLRLNLFIVFLTNLLLHNAISSVSIRPY